MAHLFPSQNIPHRCNHLGHKTFTISGSLHPKWEECMEIKTIFPIPLYWKFGMVLASHISMEVYDEK
jgi:hypothetical protein